MPPRAAPVGTNDILPAPAPLPEAVRVPVPAGFSLALFTRQAKVENNLNRHLQTIGTRKTTGFSIWFHKEIPDYRRKAHLLSG